MARTSRLRLLTDEALTDLAEAVVVDMAVENVALAVVAAAEASADTRDVADMVSAVEKDEEVIINFILSSGEILPLGIKKITLCNRLLLGKFSIL